ncbi:tetratricopeptide repeat protein [Ramlibacter sp. G-1-2-2]|uniref:protein O-GlcNAc transferase n=1 Tax=Ramlibacter agri TaxID=2728837 RepID=A0A848GWF6_9BURK|nr:tetratricopeptide repeat protein [Ramlibacter agri]NML42684.1 tetratricopeptide repeat protein [Ramlibacter agri]
MFRDLLNALSGGRRKAPAQPPAPPTESAEQWRTRGNTALGAGQLAEAERCYREATAADPADALARLNLGFALLELQRPAEAAKELDQAIALRRSDDFLHEAHFLLGRAQQAAGQPEEALASYGKAVQARAGFGEPLEAAVQLLQQAGRHAEALEWARRWAAATGSLDAALAAAIALYELQRPVEALAALDAVLGAQPDHASALEGRGNVLLQLRRPQEALASLERAVALRGPSAGSLSNIAAALHAAGRLEEGLAAAERALALDAGHRDALYNRGAILVGLLRLEEAARVLGAALQLHPGDADLRWNHAIALLLAGRLEAGWGDYEARWDAAATQPHPARRDYGSPAWTGGEDLRGKRMLVVCEQGLGDSIQFVRYLPLLQERGAQVSVLLQRPLHALVADAFPGVQVMASDGPVPASDFHCFMLSLPGAFQTTLATIPAQQQPYFRSDAQRRREWDQRLGPRGALRVGLAWSGNSAHQNDSNRSIPLEALQALARPGVQFVSVQQEVRDSDLPALQAWPGGLLHFGKELRTMADTAALIDNLDLLVSVDTSVAHLAGALGKPTCVLLPACPDWRWLLEREDSPWYAGMRLLRQQRAGDWTPVLGRVHAELAQRAAAASADPQAQGQELLAAGEAAEATGRVSEAQAFYARAAAALPAARERLAGVSQALELYEAARRESARGNASQAEALLRQALAAKTGFFDAWVLLAGVLEADDAQGAADAIAQALRLQPEQASALFQQAGLLRRLGQLDAATRSACRAAQLRPDQPEYLSLASLLLYIQGFVREGLEPLRRAIAAAPERLALRCRELFLQSLVEGETAESLFERHVALGRELEAAVRPRQLPPPIAAKPRLRVGFVSEDLVSHPVALFLLPLLEHHSRERFEFVCYSSSKGADHVTRQMRQLVDRWVDARELHDLELADRIAADGIDILVDLGGHTGSIRLGVFAARPAPVQVSWLGYLNTTGLTRIDYRITDVRADPPQLSQHLHTERLLYLPHSQWCYRPFMHVEAAATAPFERNGYITFGSFNNVTKLTEDMPARWARILNAVPSSRLVVVTVASDRKRAAVRAAMEQAGCAPERVQFMPRLDLEGFYRLMNDVDIALDTYPCGGGTTTFDTLWMGVPVLTATGPLPVSRSAAAVVGALGLTDWIADGIGNYEALAIERARDTATIAQLRRTLRGRMRASPLMDEKRFAADFEALLQRAWRERCTALAVPARPAAPLDLDAAFRQFQDLLAQGRYAEALAIAESAGAQAGPSAALNINKAVVLEKLGRFDEALACLDEALRLQPGRREAQLNKVATLMEAARPREAIACADALLAARPDDADLHVNRAFCHLLLGEFEQGWADHEWRGRSAGLKAPLPQAECPPWQGEDLAGRTIYVYGEQGFGDSIQFIRYLPELARRAGTVLLQLPLPLVPLLGELPANCRLLPERAVLPKVHFQASLMSLPAVLGTRLATVPAPVPYLRAEPAAVAAWRKRLGSDRLNVGIAFSGKPTHVNDGRRSIPLAACRTLASEACCFVILQPEVKAADADALAAWPELLHAGRELRHFGDTAALVEALDLVISVDTSVAHLAGALGRPVWLLLPHVPDWRWLLEREDSPWYPTARLYRQGPERSWHAPLARARDNLRALVTQRAGSAGVPRDLG